MSEEPKVGEVPSDPLTHGGGDEKDDNPNRNANLYARSVERTAEAKNPCGRCPHPCGAHDPPRGELPRLCHAILDDGKRCACRGYSDQPEPAPLPGGALSARLPPWVGKT